MHVSSDAIFFSSIFTCWKIVTKKNFCFEVEKPITEIFRENENGGFLRKGVKLEALGKVRKSYFYLHGVWLEIFCI